MRQPRPALLALVVVALVATPVATAAVTTPPADARGQATAAADDDRATLLVRSQPNTTNVLDIEDGDVERGAYGRSSLDAAAAVSMEAERLRGEYERRAFELAYANSTDRDARLRAEVRRLELRVERLADRQQRVIAAYNEGDVSTDRLLRELAVVDAAAGAVAAQFRRLENRRDVLLSDDLERRVSTLETETVPLRGTARARAGAAMSGDRPPTSVYALTSERGLVLAAVDGDRYVREASLPENRDPGGADSFVTDDDPTGVGAANDRARELYPWTYDNAGPSLARLGQTSVYAVTLEHPHGTLETYLDGSTREVFRERQTLRTDRLPTRAVTNATSAVTVRVNRTYGTGPMEVTATDSVTGDPVDATVVVDGERVGRTGVDGRLWTVAPHGTVRVEVRTGADTVEVDFSAE